MGGKESHKKFLFPKRIKPHLIYFGNEKWEIGSQNEFIFKPQYVYKQRSGGGMNISMFLCFVTVEMKIELKVP